MKLIRLDFAPAFWITRVGDFIYLFDWPSGQQLGRGIFAPRSKTEGES